MPSPPLRTACCGLLLALAADAAPASPPESPSGCAALPAPLALWYGDWDAYAEGKLDGHDRVEPLLGGCAVSERWQDVSGQQGFSLFYYAPHERTWKQVWVTERADLPGGVKEKRLLEASPTRVRFQGTVWNRAGDALLDRTTLERRDDGSVRQRIESSRDDGATWTTRYDAVYRRGGGGA